MEVAVFFLLGKGAEQRRQLRVGNHPVALLHRVVALDCFERPGILCRRAGNIQIHADRQSLLMPQTDPLPKCLPQGFRVRKRHVAEQHPAHAQLLQFLRPRMNPAPGSVRLNKQAASPPVPA